jgi:branched-chain amino acid transport system substrate-binding protein
MKGCPVHFRRSLGGAASLTLALVLAAGCGSSTTTAPSSTTSTTAGASGGQTSSGSTGKPFNILAILSTSGPAASFGQASEAGLRAGMDMVNAHGGVGGRQVQVTVQDDGGEATQAVTKLQSAISSGNPIDAVWTVTSQEGTALAPVTAKAGLLLVTTASTSEIGDSSKYPLVFGFTSSTQTVSDALVGEMVAKGYKKLAQIASSDAYGQSTLKTIQAAAQKNGATVTAVEVDPNVVDATPALQKIASDKPDAIILTTSTAGNAAASVLKARTKLGLQDIPTYGDQTAAAYPVAQQTSPDDWKNVFMQLQPFQSANSPATQTTQFKEFRAALEKYAPSPLKIQLPIYVHSYDCSIFLRAAAAAGTDPQALAKGLRGLGSGKNVEYSVAQTTLWTDPQSNFPALTSSDYVFEPLGPVVDGLVQPQS